MDELILSFIEKLGLPQGLMRREGDLVDRSIKRVIEKNLPLERHQEIALGVILQFSDISLFTREELIRVGEMRLDLLDSNPNESLGFSIRGPSRLYSSGSMRVYRELQRAGLPKRHVDVMYARSIAFNPKNIILAALEL